MTSLTKVRNVLDRYLDAWKHHDIEGILALHHPESTFRLHTLGEQDATGKDAIRTAFETVFSQWPDLAFESRRLHVAGDLVVHEMTIMATPAGSLTIDDKTFDPAHDEPIRFDQLDVLEFREGLVWRKDTYVDAMTVMAGLQPRSM